MKIKLKIRIWKGITTLFMAITCICMAWFGIKAMPKKKAAAISASDVYCRGVDISKWQGTVNFTTMKNNANAKFVILRLGYGKGIDSNFDTYLAGAQAAGLPIGVYLFTCANTVAEAKAEAEWTVQQLNNRGLNNQKLLYPVFYDYEDETNDTTPIGNRSKAENTAIINAYLDTVRAAGYYPGLYIGGSNMNNRTNINQINGDIWVAAYQNSWDNFTSKYYNSKVTMWQFSDGQYKVPTEGNVIRTVGSQYGVQSANIDEDYCFVNYPEKIRSSGLNGFSGSSSGGSSGGGSTGGGSVALATYGYGYTVSAADGDIDFAKMGGTNADFAFVRMGNATQKSMDGQFTYNMDGLLEIGKKRGVMVNSSAGSEEAARAEALWVIDTLKGIGVGQVDYPITMVYDYTVAEKTKTTAIVNAFNSTMEANGCVAMLYTTGGNFNNYIDKEALNCDVYLAWYSSTSNGDTSKLTASKYYHSSVKMWQYSNGDEQYGCKYTSEEAGSGNTLITQNYALANYPTVIKSAGQNVFEKPKYTISTVSDGKGRVNVSASSSEAGAEITITTMALSGYEIDKIYVNEEEIEGSSFIMPSKEVTVRATFKAIETKPSEPNEGETGGGEPNEPEIPDNPEIPETPETPENPNNPDDTDPNEGTDGEGAQEGEEQASGCNGSIVSVGGFVCALAVAMAIPVRKRKEK